MPKPASYQNGVFFNLVLPRRESRSETQWMPPGCTHGCLMDIFIFPNMNSMQTEFQFNGTARLSSEACRLKVGAASDDLTVEGSSYISLAHPDGMQPF